MFNKEMREDIQCLNNRLERANKDIATLEKKAFMLDKYKECSECGHLVNPKFMKSEDKIEMVDQTMIDGFGITHLFPNSVKAIVTCWTCNICKPKIPLLEESIKTKK